MTLSEELRNKKSRDNRELLNRAADEIERLQDSLRLAVALATVPKGDGGIKQYGGYVEVTDVLDLPSALTNEQKVSEKGKYIDADALIKVLKADYEDEGLNVEVVEEKGLIHDVIKYSYGQSIYLKAIERVKESPVVD